MRRIRLSAYRHVTKSGSVTKTLHEDSTAHHERNWIYIYRSENYLQQTLHTTSHAHVTVTPPSSNHGCRTKAYQVLNIMFEYLYSCVSYLP